MVESGRGSGVHEFQLHVGDLNAMLQHVQQAAAGLGHLGIYKADKGILKVGFIDFTERRHLVGLSVVQELEQQLAVHGEQAVIAGCFADNVTVVLREPVHDEMLVFFFGENIIHVNHPLFLSGFYFFLFLSCPNSLY